eukprot:g38580.t1
MQSPAGPCVEAAERTNCRWLSQEIAFLDQPRTPSAPLSVVDMSRSLQESTSNKLEIFLRTNDIRERGWAPVDYRFEHSQNHNKHCWVLFNEMLNCMKHKGEDAPECAPLEANAYDICPKAVHAAKWKEMRREGLWYGVNNPVGSKDEEEEE